MPLHGACHRPPRLRNRDYFLSWIKNKSMVVTVLAMHVPMRNFFF